MLYGFSQAAAGKQLVVGASWLPCANQHWTTLQETLGWQQHV
jgi:hypothetical protein